MALINTRIGTKPTDHPLPERLAHERYIVSQFESCGTSESESAVLEKAVVFGLPRRTQPDPTGLGGSIFMEDPTIPTAGKIV